MSGGLLAVLTMLTSFQVCFKYCHLGLFYLIKALLWISISLASCLSAKNPGVSFDPGLTFNSIECDSPPQRSVTVHLRGLHESCWSCADRFMRQWLWNFHKKLIEFHQGWPVCTLQSESFLMKILLKLLQLFCFVPSFLADI